MEQSLVADLEAELGCLEPGLPAIGPNRGHGNSDTFFKPDPKTIYHLNTSSKKKSIHGFGDNGTLAWATPAGELLSVANCIGNKLIGVEYKKGIERGAEYDDRVTTLGKAINFPQGTGYSMGLSLDLDLRPVNVSYIHNRWPRFTYQHNSLDIRLQYYIDSHRVVQQYQVRNNGQEEDFLPFIVSSDICFWEHKDAREEARPVPTDKSADRLLLFQNSEVLVRDKIYKAHLRMTLFQNTQRISLWNDKPLDIDEEKLEARNDTDDTDEEIQSTESRLRDILINKKDLFDSENDSLKTMYDRYYNRDYRRKQSRPYQRKNFAEHRDKLTLPGLSTQELCMIIHLEDILPDDTACNDPDLQIVDITSNKGSLDEKRLHVDRMYSFFNQTREKEYAIIAEYKNLLRTVVNLERHGQINNFVNQLIRLGADYVKVQWIGEARYYYHFACLVAESFSMQDMLLSQTRYEYAKFLDRNGWHSTALKTLDESFQTLLSKGFHVAGESSQWTDILRRFASMYLKANSFSKAESLYTQALTQLNRNMTTYDSDSATLLEKIAYSQACQGRNKQAEETYNSLLAQGSVREVTILNNLGLVSRRQCNSRGAQEYYERALERVQTDAQKSAHKSYQRAITDRPSDNSLPRINKKVTCTVNELLALSGLFSCVQTDLHADHEQFPRISAYYIKHIDLNNLLSRTLFRRSPFREDALHFPMARHLESLLSALSIPVREINGYSGIAFINADTPYCTCHGRPAFFQFRFLIQCYRYIDMEWQEKDDADLKIDTLSRIRKICEGHLIWIFKIADSNATWSFSYSIDGAQIDYVENPLLSRATEGGYQFLKLCLYHNVWKKDWEFILNFLHSKLKQWLEYLDSTKHMNNLWIEKQSTENFKSYDTSSADGGYITKAFPHYDLSDAAVVWLALSQLDKLITSIENQSTLARAQGDRVREIRQWFESHQATLSQEHIRSNMFKTFTVPKDDVIFEPISHSKAYVSSLTNGTQNTTTGMFESLLTPNEQRVKSEDPLQTRSTGRNAKQIMAFQRKINGNVTDIQSTDFHIIEAANTGIFEGSHDHAQNAWKETLKLQRDRDILTYEDPQRVALTLLASKLRVKYRLAGPSTLSVSGTYRRLEDVSSERLATALYDSGFYAPTMVDDAPPDLFYWASATFETMSLLMASFIENEIYREVLPHYHQLSETPSPLNAFSLLTGRPTPQTPITLMTPGPLETSSRMSLKNVNDQGFLPDWMYYYPDFIHKNPLNVDIRKELETLTSVGGLESAIATWKESKSFDIGGTYTPPFQPNVIDSGVKKRSNNGDSSVKRQINTGYYYDGDEFWERLLEARSPEHAKKRLIEISSYDKGSVLACWLTAPNSERPLLMEFFRRHDLSKNFFGERGHGVGNIWDTELHLGFYQLLDGRHPEWSRAYNILNSEEVLGLSGAPRDCKIVPVAMSFRFIGDLRDRFWTCNFLSSVLHGFRSLVDEASYNIDEKFYSDKQGQRKILEMVYVERALSEMKTSTEDILAAYKIELEKLGTTVEQEENFELIHNLSSPYLKSASTLGDILQQLDSSLSVLEQWEKREDTSGLRSRWSQKDQKRHGEKLQTLNMKCKSNIQLLRMQQTHLKEQRRVAERQHSDLLSYKQLLEARTSTQTAADVRLFTYVTIIFLPLSFSSSLFSMAGAPTHSTVNVMIPTTAIALLTTFLLLANLKLMDRHWSSRMDKIKTTTREKMRAEQSNYWNGISTDLEQTYQRKFVGHNPSKRLPAESQWYYIRFWLKYGLKSSQSYVRHGVRARQAYNYKPMNGVLVALKVLAALFFIPVSVLIFFIYEIIMTAADAMYLLWVLARPLVEKTLKSPKTLESTPEATGKESLQAEGTIEAANDKSEKLAGEEDRVEPPSPPGFSKQNASRSGFLRVAMDAILQRLESPPRPIRDYTNKLNPSYDSVAEEGDSKMNGEEDGKDVVANDTPQERPHRLKRLFGRYRKTDVVTQEPQMRVDSLSV